MVRADERTRTADLISLRVRCSLSGCDRTAYYPNCGLIPPNASAEFTLNGLLVLANSNHSAPHFDSSARKVSPSRCMQFCIDASVSVPFCIRVLDAPYARVNSNRSIPLSFSNARKPSPGVLSTSGICNEQHGYQNLAI